MKSAAEERLSNIYQIADKQQRQTADDELKTEITEQLAGEGKPFEGRDGEIAKALSSVTKQVIRQRILRDQVRIDGRGLADIRQLTAEVEVIPRVHGSAIFERGETQILGITTLNMLKMEQTIDSLSPETTKRYMHNYNFPPYSVGETGRVGSPKRREIGHGALAERAIVPVLPPARSSPTRSARSPRRWAPTAPPPWARSAPPRCPCSTPACR